MLTTDFSIRKLVAGDAPAFKRLRLSGVTLYPASFTDAAQSLAEKPESELMTTPYCGGWLGVSFRLLIENAV